MLLSACSASPPTLDDTSAPINVLEQQAIIASDLRHNEAAEYALLDALKHYEATDNLPGQWRVTLMLARLQLAQGRRQEAIASAAHLQSLERQLEEPGISYDTALLQGKLHGEPYFRRALEYSDTPLQRAVALAYQGHLEQAIMLISNDAIDQPADRAFVHFGYARETRNREAMQKALSYYKLAGDSRGIADSLMSLAQWSLNDESSLAARDYAGRAQRVLEAAGDSERADAVGRWLAQQR